MTCTNVTIVLKVFISGENPIFNHVSVGKNGKKPCSLFQKCQVFNSHITFTQHIQQICACHLPPTPLVTIRVQLGWIHHTHQLHSPSPHVTSISCIIEHFINYLEPVFIPIIKAAEIERYDLYECDYSLQSIYFRWKHPFFSCFRWKKWGKA